MGVDPLFFVSLPPLGPRDSVDDLATTSKRVLAPVKEAENEVARKMGLRIMATRYDQIDEK